MLLSGFTFLLYSASNKHGDAQSREDVPQHKLERAIVSEKVAPDYTPGARASGLQGNVVLYVEIGATGQVEKTEVLQSLGMGLDDKAMAAVKRWKFTPGTRDGAAVSVQQSVEIPFLLPGNSWRIKRCYYQAHRGASDIPKRLSEPVLTQYVSPPSQACTSKSSASVSFNISKEGKVEKADVVSQVGAPSRDAVVQSALRWTFQPGSINGKPKEASGLVELECNQIKPSEMTFEDNLKPSVFKAMEPGVSSPQLISKVEPYYSREARDSHLSGLVRLSIVIDPSGHVGNMLVTKPLGLGLDEKAMQAVIQWRFKPGEKDGNPVAIRATVEVNFKLR
jgi:TonB family protein